MNDTEGLFHEHLTLITRAPERWLSLISDDAVIEFPFAGSLMTKTSWRGREEIRAYIEALPKGFEAFEARNVKIHLHADPSELTAEFQGRIPATDETPAYEQTYICFFKVKDGKILTYREYWDPIQVQAFFAGSKQ